MVKVPDEEPIRLSHSWPVAPGFDTPIPKLDIPPIGVRRGGIVYPPFDIRFITYRVRRASWWQPYRWRVVHVFTIDTGKTYEYTLTRHWHWKTATAQCSRLTNWALTYWRGKAGADEG